MKKLQLVVFYAIVVSFILINGSTAYATLYYYYDGEWHDYNNPVISIHINGETVETGVPPLILGNRTMVPVRAVFEKLGSTVVWEEASQKVIISLNTTTVVLAINSDVATVNGRVYKLDVPAKIINSSTMIPIRFVAENIGMDVIWNGSENIVDLIKISNINDDPVLSKTNIQGIDISNWQGNINFSNIKNGGVKVVYIKATEGLSYNDPFLLSNYKKAKAHGLKVGFYHYLTDDDPVEEAKHFLSQVNELSADCKYMIDVEDRFGHTSKEISSNVRKFADYLISQGKEPGVYTYLNFYNKYFEISIKDLPIWIAQYDVEKPSIEKKYVGWQYGVGSNVYGIGRIDLDIFNEGIFIKGQR